MQYCNMNIEEKILNMVRSGHFYSNMQKKIFIIEIKHKHYEMLTFIKRHILFIV